jgi:hypothetical protein
VENVSVILVLLNFECILRPVPDVWAVNEMRRRARLQLSFVAVVFFFLILRIAAMLSDFELYLAISQWRRMLKPGSDYLSMILRRRQMLKVKAGVDLRWFRPRSLMRMTIGLQRGLTSVLSVV